MGQGDHLDNGVMFPPMAGIVDHTKSSRPGARHVMHDTFIGRADGLRSFKTTSDSSRTTRVGAKARPAELTRTTVTRAVTSTVHSVDDHRILHKECVSLRGAATALTLIAPDADGGTVKGVSLVGFVRRRATGSSACCAGRSRPIGSPARLTRTSITFTTPSSSPHRRRSPAPASESSTTPTRRRHPVPLQGVASRALAACPGASGGPPRGELRGAEWTPS
jgi:hypothetical protein